ncbi:hypothetical protein [Aquimarina sp. AU58]|uniref:hypothetical protein n=1 Tax=Aquimarina sp. AU58 TaxID=1874112 RepID=UPI000D6DCAC3|nr:hypothetical protein [Aquimarina sp. AU58]
MRNLLQKYGVWEYVLFVIGLLVLGKLTYDFLFNTLEYSVLNGIAFVVGVLLIAAPATLVKAAKQKLGQNGKANE